MPLGVAAHQTAEEEAAIEALRDDPQATDEPPPPDEGDAPPASEQTAEAPTGGATTEQPGDKPAAPADQQSTDDKPKGEPRAALRAARRGEARERARAERAEAELAELRKRVPDAPPPPPADGIGDEDLAALEADFPVVAKALKAVRASAPPAQAATTQEPTAAEPEFVPPTLPTDVQELVDDIPDLLAWQHDPDQTRWEMAKAEVHKLNAHPKWRDRSDADRFAEAARRVADEFDESPANPSPTPPATTANDVRQVASGRIAAAERRTPASIAAIGGGGGTANEGSSLSRFMHMSEDDALAELEREG